jgi:Condensation domain/TubC N-terminal docking domain
MTALELLALLGRRDVRLAAVDGRLRFSAPPGALTDELRAALAERRDELIALLSAGPAEEGRIPRAPRDGPLPVSPEQEDLLRAREVPGARFNKPLVARVAGAVDPDALERALGDLVRRHELLRTTFQREDGRWVQVVGEATVRGMLTVETGTGTALEHVVRAEVQRPFDLAAGPLLHLRLLRLSDTCQVLCATLDPLLWDGWSRIVFVRELVALYQVALAGRPPPLPPLAIQYGDYAAWRHGWLDGPEAAAQLRHWRAHLAGAPPSPRLSGAGRARAGFAGTQHLFRVDHERTEALAALGRTEGVTLFVTLLAAFEATLLGATGETDVVVGVPMANRVRSGTPELIGPFVNTLGLRTSLAGDPTFRELLGRVRTVATDAQAHQEAPQSPIAAEAEPAADPLRPLFQVTFNMVEGTTSLAGVAPLPVEPVAVDSGRSDFHLTLAVERWPDGLRAALVHALDVYDAPLVERLAKRYVAALDAVVADPDRRLSSLSGGALPHR